MPPIVNLCNQGYVKTGVFLTSKAAFSCLIALNQTWFTFFFWAVFNDCSGSQHNSYWTTFWGGSIKVVGKNHIPMKMADMVNGVQ